MQTATNNNKNINFSVAVTMYFRLRINRNTEESVLSQFKALNVYYILYLNHFGSTNSFGHSVQSIAHVCTHIVTNRLHSKRSVNDRKMQWAHNYSACMSVSESWLFITHERKTERKQIRHRENRVIIIILMDLGWCVKCSFVHSNLWKQHSSSSSNGGSSRNI